MSDWTWKQAVVDEALSIVNRSRSLSFSLDDLYSREYTFQQRFPNNRHVREKVRQTLQRLRYAGVVTFLGSATYELNLDFPEIEIAPATQGEEGIHVPATATVIRSIRLRNTLLSADLKRRYRHCCQVCRATIKLVHRDYAEAHHLHPIGSPHFGPDVEGNIIVVCPNHHVMFDRGAISIDPASLLVQHIHGAFEQCRLYVAPWHKLDVVSLSYYRDHIFGN